MQTVTRPHGRPVRESPRRPILVAIASGELPPDYLRSVLGMTDAEAQRAIAEATHVAFGDA